MLCSSASAKLEVDGAEPLPTEVVAGVWLGSMEPWASSADGGRDWFEQHNIGLIVDCRGQAATFSKAARVAATSNMCQRGGADVVGFGDWPAPPPIRPLTRLAAWHQLLQATLAKLGVQQRVVDMPTNKRWPDMAAAC